VVNSHDTDFGTLLAHRRLSKPSFVLIRSSDPIDVDDQANLIAANLDAMDDDLEAGAIAVRTQASHEGRAGEISRHSIQQTRRYDPIRNNTMRAFWWTKTW